MAAPYDSTGSIRLKGWGTFIIRVKTEFKFYKLRNGKSLKIIIETKEATDLENL